MNLSQKLSQSMQDQAKAYRAFYSLPKLTLLANAQSSYSLQIDNDADFYIQYLYGRMSALGAQFRIIDKRFGKIFNDFVDMATILTPGIIGATSFSDPLEIGYTVTRNTELQFEFVNPTASPIDVFLTLTGFKKRA